MEKPQVSVVVPTYNSAATLGNCLESVRGQSYSCIEIIVVDGGSTDATAAIARQYEAKIIRQKSTAALARNIGTTNSSGKYVVFVDSDQILSNSVVQECVGSCEESGAGMVRVPEIFVGEGFWGSCSAEWKNTYERVEQEYGAARKILASEPRFYAKEQIVRAGMYNGSLVWGEDYDLYERMRKLGVKEAVCKSEIYHREPTSLRPILFRLFRYGNSMPAYTRSTGQRVLGRMISHSLLALKELLKQHKKYPTIVVGCTILFCLKTCFMAFGLAIGSLPQ
jgi:cellulose synthase/poly-beta-1,6-N-acetylglucosamine synthase-like glycosyltransferase